MERAKKILKEVFGYEEFRSLQERVIAHVLEKKDTLVIMPTGGGKSLCYQIPSLIFKGLTIVVSPLISLMKDQVEQLNEFGIPAVLLNSTLTFEQYSHNVGKLHRNEVRMLYLAPESLLKPRTLEMLSTLPIDIDCITIDEAHCISEWGHDFRPEYRQIVDIRQRFPKAVCIALTATATERVRQDIKKNLKLESSSEFMDSFDRANLFLRVVPKQNPTDQVLRMLNKFPDQSGIIYCFSRKQVDELSAHLAGKGFSVRPYHAGLPEKERKENQELFIRDDVHIIVATIAFGMGINKSNVRFVVHYDLPKNIESYYQEIGRAGRDGVRAYCLLLFGYGDIRKIRYFIDQKEDEEQRIANLHLNAMLRYAETDVCRRVPLLSYFGEDYKKINATATCDMCDNCTVDEKDLTDITIPAQKFLSCVRKTGQLFGAGHIIDVLRGSKSQKVIKFSHDTISTYNIGTDLSKKQWFHLSRQFVQKGLLIQDQQYGSLKVTPKGISILRGQETLKGMLQEDRTSAVAAKKDRKPTLDPSIEYDGDLFERLREVRKQQARKYSLPPYMIFSDKSLIGMAAEMPRTKSAFLQVHGVGSAKLKKYGKIFMETISAYYNENQVVAGPLEEKNQPPVDPDNYDHYDADEKYDPDYEPAPQLPEHMAPDFPPQESIPLEPDPEVPAASLNYQQLAEAFNAGQTVQELTDLYCLKQEKVISYLLKYVQKGNWLRPQDLLRLSNLSPQQQTEVMETLIDLGASTLEPVYHALNGQVDYKELKILQLYHLACRSNPNG